MTEVSSTETQRALISRIHSRRASVGVIGLGYVGLPLALLFSENDFPLLGFDIDSNKVDALNRGASYIRHIGVERVAKSFLERGAKATDDFARLAECDAVVVCVPTPLGRHREPDLTFIRVTTEVIAKHLRLGQLIVLESTTYPGTTREEMLPRFEQTGMKCGADFFLAFSPEREDPGNESFQTKKIPKLVGGIDGPSRDVAVALYSTVIDNVVSVSSAEVAESAKLLENIFRSVNIALVNELKVVFDRMGINIWEVIEAAKTKPFGFMPGYPGPGTWRALHSA
jgi:UDP-N-acetyl-D-glucosamine dehydrogenase